MAGHKVRVPLQVSDKFAMRLRELQKKIRMSTGTERSLREITEDIVNSDIFKEMEKNIMRDKDINMDIRIKMDRRFL